MQIACTGIGLAGPGLEVGVARGPARRTVGLGLRTETQVPPGQTGEARPTERIRTEHCANSATDNCNRTLTTAYSHPGNRIH